MQSSYRTTGRKRPAGSEKSRSIGGWREFAEHSLETIGSR